MFGQQAAQQAAAAASAQAQTAAVNHAAAIPVGTQDARMDTDAGC